jgi:hypothetical protein
LIEYNAEHSTTVYGKNRRPVTLNKLDSSSRIAELLPGQHSGSLSEIPGMDLNGCNFMDLITLPQLLTGKQFSNEDISKLWAQSIVNSYMEMDAYVNNREGITGLALNMLGYRNIGISVGAVRGQQIGYRVEIPYGNSFHYLLTGMDMNITLYNPGYIDSTRNRTGIGVYLYGR